MSIHRHHIYFALGIARMVRRPRLVSEDRMIPILALAALLVTAGAVLALSPLVSAP